MGREPDHEWNDPDGDGHNCIDCPNGSVWRCDEMAHIPATIDRVMAEARPALEEMARVRRQAADSAAVTPLES